jgi:replicative superfamily II helicase
LAENLARTTERISNLLLPGVRENLIPRGLARELIWQDGTLPPGAPNFAPQLSDDLLDYGYTLLRHALVLHEAAEGPDLARSAFERAAEAIESVVRNGDPEDAERGFHKIVAACAYHLAHFAARSYSLLPRIDNLNLSPAELGLAYLLRRSLSNLRRSSEQWLADAAKSDDQIAARLASSDDEFDLEDVFQLGLTSSFLKALATFDFALTTGSDDLALSAIEALGACEAAAGELNVVTSWWTSKLAKNLVSDLWEQSLHRQLPPELPGADGHTWPDLRSLLISTLQAKRIAEIELWPSQIEAAKRVSTADDDLVVSLPTSAGKTRIAELCILRALASGKRVVYVTPLRALSAQVERDLRETFQPLGFTVSSLYGASGEVGLDTDTLANRNIVVSTPEKLDFALRQDQNLLDDVELIVLDEAHTIGPGEREVRYEVLVQRLLKRSDAASRRLVCLSAILPRGEQLDDFVSWIRQGEPGDAVVANWRPTRQRFGTVTWRGQFARLDLDVENEKAFIARFVSAVKVPKARTRIFPKDGGELALATAWQIAKEGRSALIFCPQKNLVASLAKKLLDLHTRLALDALVPSTPRLERAKRVGTEWLGPEHPAVKCLDVGVAVHHAGLPKAFLRELEGLLRAREVPVVIASPTLAQGLNLSASSLLIYHLRRGKNLIEGEEFGNVIGRAGRARVDIDGQILYVCFEPTQQHLKEWRLLKEAARERSIQSGLFAIIAMILRKLHTTLGLDTEELLEYVAGHSSAWDTFKAEQDEEGSRPSEELLASLDSAILALVERLDCEDHELPKLLDDILQDSLWTRTLARRSAEEKEVQRALLQHRASFIWSNSTEVQRRGYFAAGVGFRTGSQLDDRADDLNLLLLQAEQAIAQGDTEQAIASITEFADIALTISPFAPKELPDHWHQVLRDWISGRPMAEIVAADPEGLVEFVDDAIVYRLVWAVEAIRVRSHAHQDEYSDLWTGRVAEALEAGTTERCAVILIHAGLGSRVAALAALQDFPSDFEDYQGMKDWLNSEEVAEAGQSNSWPTPETADLWSSFVNSTCGDSSRPWSIQSKRFAAVWHPGISPQEGEFVRLVRRGARTAICSSDFTQIGNLKHQLPNLPGVLFGNVAEGLAEVDLTYHGPVALK